VLNEFQLDVLSKRVKGWDEFRDALSTSEDKKRQLLAMPRGTERPTTTRHPLGIALSAYTGTRSRYDPEFDKAIRARQPQWFINTATEKKKLLLAMPRGTERPTTTRHPLGVVLFNYTRPQSNSYDPEFDKVIRARQPKWFINTATEKKKLLLAMSKGAERPTQRHPLGKILVYYTCRTSSTYDPEFDKAIRARQPQWFRSIIAK
jgi:hypothetical protein